MYICYHCFGESQSVYITLVDAIIVGRFSVCLKLKFWLYLCDVFAR